MAGRFSPWYHERLTARVAKELAAKGYRDVRADVRGYSRPQAVPSGGLRGRQVPDVTAWSERLRICEVETFDSLRDGHVRDQWVAFSDFARKAKGEFCVVVPKGLRNAAERTLDELHLDATVIEVSVLP